MVTTKELKFEMGEKIDKAIRKGKSLSDLNKKSKPSYPDGVKFHMYRDVSEDNEKNKK